METQNTSKAMINFILKAIVITICISFLIPSLKPDFKWIKTTQGKLIVASFIHNPAVLWKLSEQQEAEKKYKDANALMDVAIGLLEMNCTSPQVFSKYQKRRDYLNSLIEQ